MTPRLRKILVFAGAGLALYAVAGFLVAPRILRSVLLENLGKTLATTGSTSSETRARMLLTAWACGWD